MTKFIGRQEELTLLRSLLEKRSASLVVIYGRRRVGKSRLIEEFGSGLKLYPFAGLAPQPHTTRQSQLDEFASQLAREVKIPKEHFNDWGDAFHTLASHTRQGRVIVLLDEITWLGDQDPNFLGKLQNAWEKFKKNDQLILILCGSVSTWINENILSNTGFYGRVSLKINLKELPIKDCNNFWQQQSAAFSAYDKLKILAVTGGIPKYLEEVKPNLSAEENIKQMGFLESGILFNDFDYIFTALLQRESPYYERILLLLKESSLEQTQLIEQLEVESGGSASAYLNELVIAGFIARDYTWHLNTGKIAKLSRYRLSDNYLRFYFKYIEPNIQKIRNEQFVHHSLGALPGWTTLMGFQMENLVLNNRHDIKERLGVYPDEVIYDNPYFQRKTARQQGCQIDYLIQTKFGNLYVCEIKFTRSLIRKDIINEIQEKIRKLVLPRNFSIKPILIYAGELHDEVLDSDFFAKKVNLATLFD